MTSVAKPIAAAWWIGETPITFAAAPKHFPERSDGRPISVSAIYRYTTGGLNGVRLRRFKSGHHWCTTVEEIGRWQAALTSLAGEEVA